MIKHIKQPEGSSLCGQCCIGIYLGTTLEESISRFGGKATRTRTREVCNALAIPYRKLNVIHRGVNLPEVGILKITWTNRKNNGHWILKVGDIVHDPALDGPATLKSYECWLPKINGKITSFIKLES